MTTLGVTLSELADELGHKDGGQRIQVFLRVVYGTIPETLDSGILDPELEALVRREFPAGA